MKSVVNHLEKTFKEMDEAIKIEGARILEMEVSLTHAKLRLSEDIQEADAIYKAIKVLSEGEGK